MKKSENLNRRDFLEKSAATAGAAGFVSSNIKGRTGSASIPSSKDQDTTKTLLAIGAHYDDCVFGIPGILLEAVRQNYRVVILNLIGDYSNWKPVRERVEALRKTSIQLASERGIEMRFLDYASMHFEIDVNTKRDVAEVVAEVQPEMAFLLWRYDRHPDHEIASQLSEMALRQPGAILRRSGVRSVRKMFYYDNGPGHTVGFEPDTFVDVSDHWTSAMEWLGRLIAFVHERPFDPESPDRSQTVKRRLARYRGLASSIEYAEAVRAYKAYPAQIF